MTVAVPNKFLSDALVAVTVMVVALSLLADMKVPGVDLLSCGNRPHDSVLRIPKNRGSELDLLFELRIQRHHGWIDDDHALRSRTAKQRPEQQQSDSKIDGDGYTVPADERDLPGNV